MRTVIVFLFMLLATAACQPGNREGLSSGSETTLKNDFLIIPGERFGPITRQAATGQDLTNAFGARNVIPANIAIGEGFTLPGYLVFPNSKNELEVVYDPETDPNVPAFIRIAREDGRWRTAQGIKPGISLQQLQEINGKPFIFSGFGWDYGGRVTDWNGGALDANTMIVLDNFSENAPEFIFGDLDVASDNPELQRLIIKVIAVEIRL